jgi:hypothetical protein
MSALFGDRVYDAGLNALDTEANILHICTAQPTTYAGIAAVSLGTATPSIGAPAAATPNGRKVTVAAITGTGAISSSGNATHYAIADTVNSRLLVANTLDALVAVTAGQSFSLPAFDIRLPAPA